MLENICRLLINCNVINILINSKREEKRWKQLDPQIDQKSMSFAENELLKQNHNFPEETHFDYSRIGDR